jgi:hypothetical protein
MQSSVVVSETHAPHALACVDGRHVGGCFTQSRPASVSTQTKGGP